MNTRTHTMARVSRVTLVLAASAALALSMAYLVRPALATQPDPLHKVTICHRTNSTTNPYVIITVDEASVDGDNGNDNGKGDHLLEHLGPVFDFDNPPPPPHNGDQWGDIIPPFYSDGVTLTGYPTLNWDAAGQAIFANGCNFPGESVEESVAESVAESIPESEAESVAESAEQSVEGSVSESVAESEAESVAESVAESEAESVAESEAESVAESIAESVAESMAESEAESVAESAEQSVEGSTSESVAESEAESVAESAEQSVEASGEQSVEAGTGTPAATTPDGALSLNGTGAIPTIAFSLILLASLGALAFANVKAVRKS